MHMQTRELVLPAWLSGRASLKASIPLQIIFIAKNITQEILVWGDVYLLYCDLQRPHQTAQLLRKRATSLEIGACVVQESKQDFWQLTNQGCLNWSSFVQLSKIRTQATRATNTAQLVLHLDRREEVHMPRSSETRVKFLSRWQSPPRKSWWTQVCRFSLLILRGAGVSPIHPREQSRQKGWGNQKLRPGRLRRVRRQEVSGDYNTGKLLPLGASCKSKIFLNAKS